MNKQTPLNKENLEKPPFFERLEPTIEYPFKLPSGTVMLASQGDFKRLLEAISRDFPEIKIVKARQTQKRLWLSTTDELQALKAEAQP